MGISIKTPEDFAEILRDPEISVTEEGFYHNKSGQQGYWVTLCLDSKWYWYSVSNTEVAVSPDEVVMAIMHGRVRRSGSYKAGAGFEATVRYGENSYMLGHGRNRYGR